MRVLISAYGCEPGKGSEPGVGWNWALQAAAFAEEVLVITRSNNRLAIEEVPVPVNLRFEYLDVPWALRAFKRGVRGARLYYVLWQRAAGRRAAALNAGRPFDVVHHLTWASISLPIGVARTDAPLVLGPLGGGVPTCWPLWRTFGLRGAVYEIGRSVLGAVNRLNPSVRRLWRRADVILVQNPETAALFPADVQSRIVVEPNAGIAETEIRQHVDHLTDGPLRAVFAARVIAWKGLFTALEALATFEGRNIHLQVFGSGPDLARARRLAARLGVSDRVVFRGHVDRAEVLSALDEADVFLLPSQHDEGPLAVVEAMARGVRPVVLNLGGPALSVGSGGAAVDLHPVQTLPQRLAVACQRQRSEPPQASLRRAASFAWPRKRPVLERAYTAATARRRDSAGQ